jgi:benzylsuccinate CoA-transferase BbsF subunit
MVAGPYCTKLMADLGAEVIKIEPPSCGDTARRSPPFVNDIPDAEGSGLFLYLNTGKLGITLDVTTTTGRNIFFELAKDADIIVEDNAPGWMAQHSIGYDDIKVINPDIIMTSITPFGQTGPYRDYKAYPLNTFQSSGEGQFIDFSAREAISCSIGESIMDYTMNGRVRTRHGNRDDILAPNNCYRCKGDDKWISISVSNDEEWKALVAAMGNPQWAGDAKFADQFRRWHNQDEIDKHIAEWALSYSDYEIMDMLQKAGVAAVPAFDSEELFTDPHCRERNVFVPTETATEGQLYAVAPPWKFSETPAQVTKAAPQLGQNNDYVLRELLGLSQKDIDKRTADGVLY